MNSNFEQRFGLVHQISFDFNQSLRRSNSVGCIREVKDVLAESVFEMEQQVEVASVLKARRVPKSGKDLTTIKIRNLRGKYSLEKLVEELHEFNVSVEFVRLFPRTSIERAWAFVVFADSEELNNFLTQVSLVEREKGSRLATGALKQRDIQYAQKQGAKPIVKKFGRLAFAEKNTWFA